MRKPTHNGGNGKSDFSYSVNLPRTEFPMRGNLPHAEPAILRRWEAMGLYRRAQERTQGRTPFILHDGPPFSNGDIHLGHALNKILKDFVVKFHSMRGEDAPFVPGWDAHGLPTEIAALRESKLQRHAVSALDLRRRCAEIARKYVALQMLQFQRLGVRGDWEHPYLTMSPEYEAGVLQMLWHLVMGGYVYRGKKPVFWCTHCETALAEAEIEYREHEAHSVYIAFPVVEMAERLFSAADRDHMAAVIWTTTPWTLPANVAVAVHPEFKYALVTDEGDREGFTYLVGQDLLERFIEAVGLRKPKVLGLVKGSELVGVTLRHPFLDRDVPIVAAEFVTREAGTGLVHLAPGHGEDDFIAGETYGLPVIQPVGPSGRYTEEAGPFAGMPIFAAEPEILQRLDRDGTLLAYDTILHQYPHCWRCRGPVIVRATPQWFVDTAALRERAQVEAESVDWLPEWGEERMAAMLRLRPAWCISRQRAWGTPIPAFYCESCNEPLLTPETIANVIGIVRQEGSDAWFRRPVAELLPADTSCPHCGGMHFRKETDILDVWFDSGSSHFAVLENTPGLSHPADLYLEGHDQYRGWFQVSLLTNAGLDRSEPPYRACLAHGFILDETGRKQSKSLGNIIDPQEVVGKYGADILRLWVASTDTRADVAMSEEAMAAVIETYRRIRNTLRFLLGNLYDFSPERAIPYNELHEMDRWVLHRLSMLVARVTEAFTRYEFHTAYRVFNEFCTKELSGFYLDVLKDRLYIPLPTDPARRSAQTALYRLADVLVRLLAPLLSFTADEAWGYLPAAGRPASAQLAEWPTPSAEWTDVELAARWARVLAVHEVVTAAVAEAQRVGIIAQPLSAKVLLYSAGELPALLESLGNDLSAILRVSVVELAPWESASANAYRGALPELAVTVQPAPGESCGRCRLWLATGHNPAYPTLCDRCADIVTRWPASQEPAA